MPRFLVPALVVMAALGLIPLALVARARVAKSSSPRFHVVFNMDQQGKYTAQQANPAFADGRAMRLPVPGTVARGDLRGDPWLDEGKVDGEWATTFPFPVTETVMSRGRELYGVFCSACHGLDGSGNGIVNVRASRLEEGTWVPPTDYHSDEIRGRAVGHLYNTIANGIRNMPAYGSQIRTRDRWAIVAYLRALQRSQNARLEDVPPEERGRLRKAR